MGFMKNDRNMNIRLKIVIIIAYCLWPILAFTQDLGKVTNLQARHFRLISHKDSIEFILVNGNLDTIKPVIIFCQGSTPIPLVIKYPEGDKFIPSLNNFDYQKLSKDFHIIVISMPYTPFEVDIQKLDKDFMYVIDKEKFQDLSPSYLANNYFENYNRRAKRVIDYLSRQKWVEKRRISIIGHSRGSKIAIKSSVGNKKIYKVAFLSGNPFGLIEQYVRGYRRQVDLGEIEAKESQYKIEDIYRVWKKINEDPNSVKRNFGDPDRTWTSFDQPLLDDFLKLEQPVYVGYGTEDIKAILCDLLPIFFIQKHKDNLTIKPYLGLEHNFYELDAKRKIDFAKAHWNDVMNDVIK
ncbi:hypothetical protein DRW42_01815 [Pedobacter miscanthi]|uniref:Alpha/beta hydrolase n=2 Tax=Pedobacter miscanthi TaxID=2259170 RepID=A0A366LDR3_9SPHI|nr:hypothetical protein DRW42_01815 [Pedobacter miscanthi]